jgi:hypothetical protein
MSLDLFAEFYRRNSNEYKFITKLHEYSTSHLPCGRKDLRWLSDEDNTIEYWFDGDTETAENFYTIAATDQSGLFGVWLLDGVKRKELPFFFLGSEGDASVIARNVFDFVALLAVPVKELEFAFSDLNFLPENPPSDELLGFHEWLRKNFQLEAPENPEHIIESAQRGYPRLDEFVKDWADKWFPAKNAK